MVDRSWVVDWGWVVDWSWLVSWLVLWVDSSAFILDISNIAGWAIGISSVGDSLGAAIRKGNSVRSSDNLGIRGLAGAELRARVVISHTVLEGIGLGSNIDNWSSMVDWSWVVDWGIVSKGNSGQSTGNSVLEHGEKMGWVGWDVEAESCSIELMP